MTLARQLEWNEVSDLLEILEQEKTAGVVAPGRMVKLLSRLGMGAEKAEKVTEVLGRVARRAALGGIAATAGIGVGVGFDNAARAISTAKARKEVEQIFPQIREMPKEHVDQAYKTLRQFSPGLASNPMTLGNFIIKTRPMAGDPLGLDAKAILDAVKVESELRKKGPLREGLMSGIGRGLASGVMGA